MKTEKDMEKIEDGYLDESDACGNNIMKKEIPAYCEPRASFFSQMISGDIAGMIAQLQRVV